MAKIQESAENYLEAILVLQRQLGEVHSVDIAAHLEFSKPSVSVAMKNLRELGCITVDGNGHIRLTDHGREIAESVYERHTLFTQWLIDLGVSRETAAEDACRMEHVLSDEAFQAIKRYVQNNRPAL